MEIESQSPISSADPIIKAFSNRGLVITMSVINQSEQGVNQSLVRQELTRRLQKENPVPASTVSKYIAELQNLNLIALAGNARSRGRLYIMTPLGQEAFQGVTELGISLQSMKSYMKVEGVVNTFSTQELEEIVRLAQESGKIKR